MKDDKGQINSPKVAVPQIRQIGIFSARKLEKRDSLPKMLPNYDVTLLFSSKSRVDYRTRAKPSHPPSAASLVTLALAQTRGLDSYCDQSLVTIRPALSKDSQRTVPGYGTGQG